jgi:hypothetical protein
MHSTNVIDVQEATLRFSKKPRVVLDGVSFCWGVDDGEHLFEMVLNQLIAVSVECGSPLKSMTTQISQITPKISRTPKSMSWPPLDIDSSNHEGYLEMNTRAHPHHADTHFNLGRIEAEGEGDREHEVRKERKEIYRSILESQNSL